ncbi:hypothetical protein G3A43_08730 [Paraburkholderia aspalathi]|nr:hypothetical protein [Paraburkholderia aspalathi]MBK3780342.1 hypothetical protein [Paraburkholderia aspalathi]
MNDKMALVQTSPATADKNSFFTPLRAYLLSVALLVFGVSAPFTIGVPVNRGGALVAAAGTWLYSRVSDLVMWAWTGAVSVTWPAHHPILSWVLTAIVGFHLVAGGILCLKDDSPWVLASFSRTAAFVFVTIIGIALHQWLFWLAPGPDTLYDAFFASGGVPAWLVTASVGLMVLIAALPFVVVGFALICFIGIIGMCAM